MISKENLNKKICDCEDCENAQTYKEYILEGEKEFGIDPENLDEFTDEELKKYLDFIDYLWEK